MIRNKYIIMKVIIFFSLNCSFVWSSHSSTEDEKDFLHSIDHLKKNEFQNANTAFENECVEPFPFLKLPVEIQDLIIQDLDFSTLKEIRLTSKYSQRLCTKILFEKSFFNLTSMRIVSIPSYIFSEASHVRIAESWYNEALHFFLKSFKTLKCLTINQNIILANALLTSDKISELIPSVHKCFEQINQLKELRHLTLENIFLMDRLQDLPYLESLRIDLSYPEIYKNNLLNDINIALDVNTVLGNVTTLQRLAITKVINSEGIYTYPHSKKVTIYLSTFYQPHLKHLIIPTLHVENADDLRKIFALETLCVNNLEIPDEFSQQAFLPFIYLRTLSLTFPDMQDYVPDLSSMQLLENLTLTYTRRNGEAGQTFPAISFSNVSNLKSLCIDAGAHECLINLDFLQGCEQLKCLKLESFILGEEEFRRILGLKSLQELYIWMPSTEHLSENYLLNFRKRIEEEIPNLKNIVLKCLDND